jgi:hypothetical protein
MKRMIPAFAALVVMALMVALTVAPAVAQQQSGLVNVIIEDVVVAVPVAVAANICNVDVNVIAAQFVGTENAVCEADADAIALVPSPFRP